MLEGKRIVLGVSGGIAAYKAVEVCRRLVDAGAHVIPVLTDGALHFVGRTTFDALGSERAWTSLWDEPHPIPHTHLGQTADLVLVAPATAQVLGLYAGGHQRRPAHQRPPRHPGPGARVPGHAHRDVGAPRRAGQPAAPALPWRARGRARDGPPGRRRRRRRPPGRSRHDRGRRRRAARAPSTTHDLTGLRVIVTAGGTREPIDPVRFIGNRSSGKQGHAVAEEAAARGAKVTLVTTTGLPASAGHRRRPGRHRRRDGAGRPQPGRPGRRRGHGRRRRRLPARRRPPTARSRRPAASPRSCSSPPPTSSPPSAPRRRPGQTIVGFAAETDDLRANAADKLARKGIDLIVANDVSAPGVGFEHDTNAVVILGADGAAQDIPLTDKRAIARAILDAVSTTRSNQ